MARLNDIRRLAKSPLPWGAALLAAFLAASAWMVCDVRRGAWREAEAGATSVLNVLARSILRDIEVYDLSIQSLARNLADPAFAPLADPVRQSVLFGGAPTATGLGMMFSVDAEGRMADSSLPGRRGFDVSGRDFYAAHRDANGAGMFVGRPFRSRLSDVDVIALSRRVNRADGSFAGVAVGTIKTAFFEELFRAIDLAPGASANLFHSDGTLVARVPAAPGGIGTSIAGSRQHAMYRGAPSGSFVATSVVDGTERLYVYRRLAGTPLVLNVAHPVDAIADAWIGKVLGLGAALGGLCLGMALFLVGIHRELRSRDRAEREASRLAQTDALTGLANRRRFDLAAAEEAARCARTGMPFAIVLIDVDHFKRLNDTFGHAAGDRVLQAVSACVAARARRSGEIACRVGGEEFAAVLPGVGAEAALEWAEALRADVAGLGLECGPVRISAGVVQVFPGEGCAEALARADAALYAAKRTGRDRVVLAPSAPPLAA